MTRSLRSARKVILSTQHSALRTRNLALGPVMLDVEGKSLNDNDRRRLLHPSTGGVILFSRNYESRSQLIELTTEIHQLRLPALPIAVDHEGGRVQRFRQEFTALPAMRKLGELWNRDAKKAKTIARDLGYVLALELRSCGVDFSFTPVLDIDYHRSAVIGDRAFHQHSKAISELANAVIAGLNKAGMISVGKHFPGHGFVEADSHHAIPVDDRPLTEIEKTDLLPYKKLITKLDAIMPAHVIYPKVDIQPAGFSERWLQQILRKQLGFRGIIFSDDLKMEGASVVGGIVARAHAALNAGCDMVLVCNDGSAADELLAAKLTHTERSARRLTKLVPQKFKKPVDKLIQERTYLTALDQLAALNKPA